MPILNLFHRFLIHKKSPQFIIHRRSSLINSQNVPHAFDDELNDGENVPSPALDGDHDLADVSQFKPSMPKKDFRSALNTLRMAFLKLLPVRRNGGAFWHKVLGRPKKLGKGDLLKAGLNKRIRFERLRKDVDEKNGRIRVLNGHPLARTTGDNRRPKKDCYDNDIDDEECLKFGITSILSKLELKEQNPTLIGNYLMKETHLHTLYNGKTTPNITSEVQGPNVLLLGLGFPNSLRKQWLDLESPMKVAYVLKEPQIIMKIPAMNKFQYYCNTRKCSRNINENQMTDFIRGIIIEELNHPCQVYSVNGCTDEVRNDENNGERELNIDLNTNAFIDALLENKWKIDMVFLDHFRMYSGYTSNSFSKGFFEGLKRMGERKILKQEAKTLSGKGEICLPFTPHFFAHVHGMKLNEYFKIEYLTEDYLRDNSRNLLYAAEKKVTSYKLKEKGKSQ